MICTDETMKWLPELFVVEKGPAVELKVLLAAIPIKNDFKKN